MTGAPAAPPRWIFVAGLHRTGTSLLARLLGAHPAIASISGSPAPEDEGCYLQGAIPHDATHGIPGHYATDPVQHLVEGGRYDTLAVRQRLEADWGRWYDPARPHRIEKSPVNLTRMRLYQQLFPLARFIVVLRHPQAMAAALAKWSDRPFDELVRYGARAYATALDDARHLHCVATVRYEDLVRAPDRELARLFTFLELEPISAGEPLRDGNRDYGTSAPVPADIAEQLLRLGYGDGQIIEPYRPVLRHPFRAVCEAAVTFAQEEAMPPFKQN